MVDLITKPGSVAVYNPYTKIGWNGPYLTNVDRDSVSGTADALKDAWGTNYVFTTVNGKHAVLSCGPNATNNSGAGDDIVVYFEN